MFGCRTNVSAPSMAGQTPAVITLEIDAVQSVLGDGDTVNDLLAGTRAGAGRVIGVLGGAHEHDQLQAAPRTGIAATVGAFLHEL